MSASADPLSARAIVARLRTALQVPTDAALARALEVTRDQVAKWGSRDSRPYPECLRVAQQTGYRLEWLLTGIGPERDHSAPWPPEPHPHRIAEPPPPIAGPAPAPPPAIDGLLLIQTWLATYWGRATPDERVWLLVQMRRAFPEFSEFEERAKKLSETAR